MMGIVMPSDHSIIITATSGLSPAALRCHQFLNGIPHMFPQGGHI